MTFTLNDVFVLGNKKLIFPNQANNFIYGEKDNDKDDLKFHENVATFNFYINELHNKVNEKTLEIIFFKDFIADISIDKIICELFINF